MKKKALFLLLVLIGLCSCDDIIEVVDISNETVTILAPMDQTSINIPKVTFSWQTLEYAESYHVQVATPNFNEASQILLDTVVTKRAVSKTLSTNDYEWRINAKNSDYETAYVTQSFIVIENN